MRFGINTKLGTANINMARNGQMSFLLFIAANNWACAGLSSCDDFQLSLFNLLAVSTKLKDNTKRRKNKKSQKTPHAIPLRTTKTQQKATNCHKNRQEPQKTQIRHRA